MIHGGQNIVFGLPSPLCAFALEALYFRAVSTRTRIWTRNQHRSTQQQSSLNVACSSSNFNLGFRGHAVILLPYSNFLLPHKHFECNPNRNSWCQSPYLDGHQCNSSCRGQSPGCGPV